MVCHFPLIHGTVDSDLPVLRLALDKERFACSLLACTTKTNSTRHNVCPMLFLDSAKYIKAIFI